MNVQEAPRCAVWWCTATELHHHYVVTGGGQNRDAWILCDGRCPVYTPPQLVGPDVMSAVRAPYRYPAPMKDLQRWSDLPRGRVWVTLVRNRFGRARWWEVSWREGDTRRRYHLPTFAAAHTFAREIAGAHPREVS